MSFPSDLGPWRLAVDTGLLVLIWLVQLVIYPSFLYADRSELVRWHGDYTGRITLVVLPLMFLQAGIVAFQVATSPDRASVLSALLVAGAWGATFLLSVPLHGRIAAGDIAPETLTALVTTNWPRTVFWTLCFCVSAFTLWSRSAPE